VLTEIKNLGTKDCCCILVCDGLTGLPDAVAQVWPDTIVQTCVVHYADGRVMPIWEWLGWSGGVRAENVGIITALRGMR
jgi:Transposase, Mutator family